MRPATASLLRGVGLLIEMGSLLAYVNLPGGRAVAGVALRPVAFAGVVLGFLLWGAGIAARQVAARRPRGPDSAGFSDHEAETPR